MSLGDDLPTNEDLMKTEEVEAEGEGEEGDARPRNPRRLDTVDGGSNYGAPRPCFRHVQYQDPCDVHTIWRYCTVFAAWSPRRPNGFRGKQGSGLGEEERRLYAGLPSRQQAAYQ